MQAHDSSKICRVYVSDFISLACVYPDLHGVSVQTLTCAQEEFSERAYLIQT